MTKPVTPQEAAGLKAEVIPEAVIQIFNILIAENLTSHGQFYVSKFEKDEAVARIKNALDTNNFDTSWLDVEPIYEKAGWKVEYNKPDYTESFPATYTFTGKRR
jgi:hypothetical protein